ncbi:hypothetical protein LTR53_001866 [Teratosphaeriaceae sp. CCFEE 6253]|nr:hypothetical protein LTR53_001866 [Teratosphaeriaceae sp. CCFEE 6253]
MEGASARLPAIGRAFPILQGKSGALHIPKQASIFLLDISSSPSQFLFIGAPLYKMPFRKSESSDAGSDSQRRSLQRLSSMASFQALNPFARRRSNKTSESTANSSSSNLSLSSTANNAPQPPHIWASTSPLLPADDELTALPIPPVPSHFPSRRSSYICLPDDPIGGMPRSRTLSNLPLPTRARRNTALSLAPSRSHYRLPSAFLPFTRVPSPVASSRQHSMSKLAPAEPKHAPTRNRMKRSDTEPLLPLNVNQVSNVGRSTAFKENLSLSPVKPLPEMGLYDNGDFYGDLLPSRSHANRHGWMDTGKGSEPLLHFDACGENFASSLPLPDHSRHAPKASVSSPAYRSSRDRSSTPVGPAPVQRWNSQPVLTNVTNRRNSRHGEILERRLLSAVQPDPPAPPPKTPLMAEALTGGRVSWPSNSSQLRLAPEQSPSLANLSTSKSGGSSPERSAQQISIPHPVLYWCGRFSALVDRYRNDELAVHLATAPSTTTATLTNSRLPQADRMHTPEATARRMRRALEHLHSLCATSEARASLVAFQQQFAALQRSAELARPLVVRAPERRKIVLGAGVGALDGGVDLGGGCGGGPGAAGEKRKGTFMERLLGRSGGRKSLAVGA